MLQVVIGNKIDVEESKRMVCYRNLESLYISDMHRYQPSEP